MERELVIRAQGGDPEAFDQIVVRITDRLYSIAYRILRNAPGAEDATQPPPAPVPPRSERLPFEAAAPIFEVPVGA